MIAPRHIHEYHWFEWLVGSAVDPELTALNLQSISGQTPYERLLYNWDSAGKVQPDAINREINRRFGDNWSDGGWWCSGIEVLTGEDSRWGCFKPDRPRIDKSKGFNPKQPKVIKYEHPVKVSTEIFCLRVSWSVGFKIARRFGYEQEYRQRFLQAYGREETERQGQQSKAEVAQNGDGYRSRLPNSKSSVREPSSHQAGKEGGTAVDNIFGSADAKEFLRTVDREFWQWVIQSPGIAATITEGVKKAASLLSQGYAAIAIPGIWSGIRQPKDELGNRVGRAHLIPQLTPFAQNGRQIYLAFDQDGKQSTVRKVNQAIATTASLFCKQGSKVSVVTWPANLGKGVDDVIVSHGAEAFDKFFQAALPSEVWGVQQLSRLTYFPDLEVDYRKLTAMGEDGSYSARFYPPSEKQIVGIKSLKDTAKTEYLACLIKPFLHQGGKVLIVTHRIQLGEALCQRFGVNYVTEIRDSDTGQLQGYGLCVDSLHPKSQARFNPKDWEEAWVIIDEAEQVFWHLLNSSTCQKERVEILQCLQETIQIALSTGGKVFLSDADLSDVSIDYVRSLAGFDIQPWIVVNNWKPEKGWNISTYPNTGKNGNNPKALVADLVKYIEDGGRPFICLSGQQKKSRWGTQILESYLKSKFPDKRILRIDRESIADPENLAYGCITRLDEILPQYDIVLASPTIETGVSINCHHFTSVWGIFQGVQTTDSVRQALARVRDCVPRHIWIRKTGFSRVGNGSTSVKALLASQHQLTKANINLLAQSDFTEEIDADFQPQSLRTWAKKAALVNLGMANYSDTILQALADEGHTLNQIEAESLDQSAVDLVKDAVDATQAADYQAHNEAVSQSASISDELSWKALKEKRSKTASERLQFQKGEVERLYNVPVTPQLIESHDVGWYPKIRLHYYLSVGRKHLSDRDIATAKKQLEHGNGAIFKPDFNRSQLGLKVWLIEQSGFLPLLNKPELRADDPELSQVADFFKQHRFETKNTLGLSINPESAPMAIAQRLAGLIGYRFPLLRKEGSRQQQVRVYGAAAADFQRSSEGEIAIVNGQAIPLPDGREEVFAVWVERDVAAAQAAETAAATAATAQESKGGQALEKIVSSSDTVVAGCINIDLYGGVRLPRGATTEVAEPEAAESTVEELCHRLQSVDSSKTFADAVEGYQAETVEGAISVQDTAPRRQQLREWWESLKGVGGGKAGSAGQRAIALCENSLVLSEWWQQIGGGDSGELGNAGAIASGLTEGSKVRNTRGFRGFVKSIVSGRAVVEFVGAILGGQRFEVPIDQLVLDCG